MKKGECVICGHKMGATRAHLSVCHKKECKPKYHDWCRANFDLMDDTNKYKSKYEDEFWELNDTQRKQFARFFELQRPAKMAQKKRRSCLRCGGVVRGNGEIDSQYRICPHCHAINKKFGAVACGL